MLAPVWDRGGCCVGVWKRMLNSLEMSTSIPRLVMADTSIMRWGQQHSAVFSSIFFCLLSRKGCTFFRLGRMLSSCTDRQYIYKNICTWICCIVLDQYWCLSVLYSSSIVYYIENNRWVLYMDGWMDGWYNLLQWPPWDARQFSYVIFAFLLDFWVILKWIDRVPCEQRH